jgi:hypothetical protein
MYPSLYDGPRIGVLRRLLSNLGRNRSLESVYDGTKGKHFVRIGIAEKGKNRLKWK